MSEHITETVTISFERYDEMVLRINEMENESREFHRLFAVSKTDDALKATVKFRDLQKWATENISRQSGFLNIEWVKELEIVDLEETK